MALETSLITWVKYRFGLLNKVEEHDHRVIECSLINSLTESRKCLLSHMKLSQDFDKKLLEKLKDERIEEPTAFEKFYHDYLSNRPVNYSFSAAMVLAIVFIGYNYRTSSPSQNNQQAGVVIENTEYLDRPSKATLFDEDEENFLLGEIQKDPANVFLLQRLENYYDLNGKKDLADQIRHRVEKLSKK
ncbi:MAG: hypothetical protein K8R21_06245 [Leptospira sp.]|nr:hypothetical protein [Leptospira sp.]